MTQLPVNIGQVRATDGDLEENGRISYSIQTQGMEGVFQLSHDGTVLLIGQIDREEQGHYVLAVMAMDHGIPPRYVSYKQTNVSILQYFCENQSA